MGGRSDPFSGHGTLNAFAFITVISTTVNNYAQCTRLLNRKLILTVVVRLEPDGVQWKEFGTFNG